MGLSVNKHLLDEPLLLNSVTLKQPILKNYYSLIEFLIVVCCFPYSIIKVPEQQIRIVKLET